MPIQTIESDRLYRKIARQISELINVGEFLPGERLPAERELAQQFGVSRPSVREALIALEVEGKVEVRVGAGVFVVAPRSVSIVSGIEEGEGPFELLRARRLIEGETAACAAREATESEIVSIKEAVEELRFCQGREGEGAEGADRAFHLGIAKATHNGPLAGVVDMLWNQGRGAIWKQMEKHFETPELRAATLVDHSTILKAIESRDARGARSAMQRHLVHVDREFARGWSLLKKSAKQPKRRQTKNAAVGNVRG